MDSSSVRDAGAKEGWGDATPAAAIWTAPTATPTLAELRQAHFHCGREEITDRVAAVLELFHAQQERRCDDRIAREFLEAAEAFAAWAVTAQQPSLAQALRQAAHDFQAIYDSPLDLDQESLGFLWDELAPELAALRLPPDGPPASEAAPAMVAVRQERLEALVERVSHLSLTAELFRDLESRLAATQVPHALLEEMRQISRELKIQSTTIAQGVVALRRLPIARLLTQTAEQAQARAVRRGKHLSFQVSGGDTEIDPTLVKDLEAILGHLLDHTIQFGLSQQGLGQVRLEAQSLGSRIRLTLSDEGPGLDPQWLRDLAVQQGLLAAAQAQRLSDEETLELLACPDFVLPGLDRGCGLPAVVALLDRLQGELRVASQVGHGTTIRLEIPLRDSVRAIDTLLVEHGGQHFAIPFEHILEIAELGPADLKPVQGRRVVALRGEIFDAISLSEVLCLPATTALDQGCQGVLVECKQGAMCLLVDRVQGHRHTVIQPLEGLAAGNAKLAGVSPLGGGRLALVLHIPAILQSLLG